MSSITVHIYSTQEINHASFVHAGLFELSQLGIINVRCHLSVSRKLGTIRIDNGSIINEPKRPQPKTSYYRIVDKSSHKSIKVAVDLYDLANQFSSVALNTCDIVFKRNYEERYVKVLPKAYRDKVKKLGMSFGVHSLNSKGQNKLLLGLILNTIVLHFKFDRFIFKRIVTALKTNMKEWYHVKPSRPLSIFQKFYATDDKSILFQTRCFPHENDNDVKSIHIQRYKLIKYLRENFNEYYKGGFVPSKISNAYYSDALTNLPTEQKLYLKAVKEAGIVIYTRGLANSPAWKLAEYLSQGKVIIAEQVTAEFPVALEHGKQVLYFYNLDELSELIKMVLDNKKLRIYLSQNARLYYEKEVHPMERMRYVVNKSLDSAIV